MFNFIDLDTFSFGEPRYLWLLAAPAILLLLWSWQARRRHCEVRIHALRRSTPVQERQGLLGDFAFWLCIIAACTFCILALALPRARISVVSRAGADIIILQDASASMYVNDVLPSRWQRSQQFVRALAEALSWKGDRVALALFAYRAAPQIRLTRDPNSLFFFLDHLGEEPPFSLDNDTTWDTNIEEGLHWGLKLIDVDEKLFGANDNAKAFIVISDGQAWSGKVLNAVQTARERRIPVFVVGVGTTAGGLIPEPRGDDGVTPRAKTRSVLNRGSLQDIANFGGGQYFEIGREPDRDLAFHIIGSVRDRTGNRQETESHEELYWRFVFAAGVFVVLGTVFLRRAVELRWQAAGAAAALLTLVTMAV